MLDRIGTIAVAAMLAGAGLAWLRVVSGLAGFVAFALGGIVALVVGLVSIVQALRGRGLGSGGMLAITAGLVLLLAASAFTLYLDHRVRTEFEGRRFALPARIYARPLELHVGLRIAQPDLEEELRDLGYRALVEKPDPTREAEGGWYLRSGERLDIGLRAFMFWDGDPAAMQGKERAAFRSGFLGVQSLGWSTLVQIVEASADDRRAAIDTLARHLVADFGAPSMDDAMAAAEEEFAFAASLCEHPLDMLVAVHRTIENGEIREAFRTLRPKGGPKPLRAFSFLEVEDDAQQPTDQVDLVQLAQGERK